MTSVVSYFYGPAGFVSIIFLVLMLAAIALVIRWHFGEGDFDLRDAVTAPNPDGKRRVDTSKFLLVGTFLVSSYLVADNFSEGALGLYLTAWVINGGAVLAYKAFAPVRNGVQKAPSDHV